MQGKLTSSKNTIGVVVGVLLLVLAVVSSAVAAEGSGVSPWWQVSSGDIPTNLAPGSTGTIMVAVTDLGDAKVEAASSPVTVIDKLPAGLTATAIKGISGPLHIFSFHGPVECTLATLTCAYEGTLPTFERLWVEISVEVASNVSQLSPGVIENEVSVTGGGAPGVVVKRPVTISGAPTGFGVEDYEITPENADGSVDTQAGSHPFQLTTTLAFNETEGEPFQPALPKDLQFKLPAGLVGNPTPFPQCTESEFYKQGVGARANLCPNNTVVGVAAVSISEKSLDGQYTRPVPLFNLTPAAGEPARFGFVLLQDPVILDTSVRTGGDYGVTVSVNNVTELAALLASRVTFWGVPGDPRHNASRGWNCIDETNNAYGEECAPSTDLPSAPLLTLPTSCTGPLQTTVEADSWAQPEVFTESPYTFQNSAGEPFGLDGCNRLPFEPSISVSPDGQAASTPTGLSVGIHVPQETILDPNGLAEANLKDTTVTLPEGVQLSPAAADGLEACSLSQVALEEASAPTCPDASKIGTVELSTPLLAHSLEGAVYLAAQDANPFGSLVAMYIVVEEPKDGILIKIAGEASLNEQTGQIVATFKNSPQLPFEDLKLHFFGSSRAPLSTPALCGAYTTRASFAPWSGKGPAEPSSTFDITTGPNGSACSNPLPFSPSLTAGSTNIQAGAFSAFTMTMSREDGQQDLDAVKLRMPAGLLGTLSSVKLCGEAEANNGTCGPGSLIGETTVSVGLGGDPFSVTGGRVYITGPYEGAPFGLSIVNPAKAGPFNLGNVIVRAKIEVDPTTADLTITTDTSGPYAIPQFLDGIPLQIKHVNVSINRPGFTFNPTNCVPAAITGSLTSSQGSSSRLQVPFQVTNCATLGFKPGFKVSTVGKTSRANGASLSVKLIYPKAAWGTQANIKSVKVDLPKQLPSRLTTLQKACVAATFEANPASCPAASRVGTATATTPIIPVPLAGPAYFVSHGGAKFPELIVALSGYGVTVYLHGETFISKAGITSSTFREVPDVPIGSFELTLPEGSNSALAANGNLCTSTLKMPTAFTAQNGLVIHQSTPVTATGCFKHKTSKLKKKTKTKKAAHDGGKAKKR